MKAVNNQFGLSKIGRVVVAKLRPFSTIAPHIDEGEYTKNHDRFHFVVTTNPNVRFGCGDEEAHMAAGDIWWFDNKTQHYVTNAGNTDRIHIVVDIRK
jgi:quercetin dioxygenase-like cupin family protein